MQWYRLSRSKALETIGSGEDGLTSTEAAARRERHGRNELPEAARTSRLKILAHQFASPLIIILLVAAGITVALGEYIDSGVILAVVVLNAVIGYVQEFRAEESMRALQRMVRSRTTVVRDGQEQEVDTADLVPGDLVLLASGDRAPADVRLLTAQELRVDEAALTGESVPVTKTAPAIERENLTPGDQLNMAFMGTIVVNGRARGLVVETGPRTVLGRIAGDVKEVVAEVTPLQVRLERFAHTVAFIVVGFSGLVFVVGVLRGESIADTFMLAVATAVSAIPEGLPVAVTIGMAVGVARMARRKAIIRRLPTVETLGSTTVIGSDKTGTLTKNEMTARLVYDGKVTYELTGSGYAPEGAVLRDKLTPSAAEHESLGDVLRIGLLCNESRLYEENGAWLVDGDPTEGALIVSAIKGGLEPEAEWQAHPRHAILPFESDRGYMASLNDWGEAERILVKGSPEKVLEMCSTAAGPESLDRDAVLAVAQAFAAEGLRVLALGHKPAPPGYREITHEDLREGVVFAGLQGLIDPPRPEAMDAIARCRTAGIRTVMITGDHAVTAVAIARRLGLSTGEPGVLTGREIELMSAADLAEKVRTVSVFARVSPQQKLTIAKALIANGEVLAITGDGVNDAPALKVAHIGVAMGKTGTDVAREAADMVLLDDNFATIVGAVEEGRVVYDNIRKVALFLVSCGLAELLAILATIVFGLPIPYLAAQILWLNLVTNGLQDIALAFEPAEAGILKRPPRPVREGILSRLMVQRSILMGVVMAAGTLLVFVLRLEAGAPIERARTAALTTMVFFQFYQALNCRSETISIFRMSLLRNPFLLFSMIAALFAQLAVLYVPALQWVFRTVPITVSGWLEILAVTCTIVVAVEADKWWRARRLARSAGPAAA
jgi:P-type Ca2+ transporter type 2C